jgi:hypothetical protein
MTIPEADIVHVPSVMMVGNGISPRTQAPASAGLKPLPEIVTAVLTGPELGVRVIVGVGLVTVNVAAAISPDVPVTRIACAPRAGLAVIVNDPVNTPPAVNWHDDDATISGNGVLVMHPRNAPTSLGLNPLPETVTVALPNPDVGIRVIVGDGLMTVNDADAVSGTVPPPSIGMV